MSAASMPFPDRDTVAGKLAVMSGESEAYLRLMFENSAQDDNLLDGLVLFLDRQAEARFLNSLKLGGCGEWLGNNAPARLQSRLSEVARSSQHPAYSAFREGLNRSGGPDRAYPKSPL